MFYDWLTIYQDFDFRLPFLGDRYEIIVDTVTSEELGTKCASFKHEGSFSTSIQIRISGNRLTVSGNPSRINRLDNLYGFTKLDDCVSVYNRILSDLGLPTFTKCTRIFHLTSHDENKTITSSDGAIITEIHVTSNRAVGTDNADDYLKALSTQRYRNSIGNLYANGKTVDWKSKKGNAALIYPSVYNKANELELHHLGKAARNFGKESTEYLYLKQVIDFCEQNGVVRFEQKLKSAYLRREGLRYWGLLDEKKFAALHDDFLRIDEKLQVESMDIEGISERLIRKDICLNTRSANTTAFYAIQWMSGQKFDSTKTQVRTHRARLRKIGIDIFNPCDLSRFSPVYVRKARAVTVQELPIPTWYRSAEVPCHLRAVA